MVEIIPVYRAPMRARDVDAPAGMGAEYGLAHAVVGIGSGRGDRSARMLHRFAEVPDGVFVWTRDRVGGYHLGRIAGELRDERSKAARAVGIVHVRDVDWLQRVFEDGDVPAAVVRTFARGGRNFQRTHDEEAERLTRELWVRERGGVRGSEFG